jgi:hypothetical protein
MFHKKSFKSFQRSIFQTLFVTFFICFTALHAFAQNNLKAVTDAFNDHHENTLQEKIYVHTDKNFYLTGEIIWFKLYNTDATFNKPLDISSVAYVEILDKLNKPVQQAKIGLNKGEGNGSFYLPQSISSGNYKLRAYTKLDEKF